MVCYYNIMHCVMLGVTKMLLELWFERKKTGLVLSLSVT